ncbi:MAG: VWA domain-containing protein [Myxococcales bacterium]|nr:VWA domain-containing protein [Myxococcales bacterium]
MERIRPTLTYLVVASASALGLWAALSLPRHRPTPLPIEKPQPVVVQAPQPVQRPQVDVVFVLDTTGSMSSLISGAKKKIWEIARFIAQGQPAPELRIGLVAYRDVGDEYVTKFFDLTDDMDGVYQNLSSFSAGGGGDTPEHVAKALHDAVYRSSWSPGKNTLKMVYLVGDAPPHSDYQDGFNHRTIANEARSRGIRINTVRCGLDEETRVAFTDIASLSSGDFSSIDQSGGMQDIKTPFDEELARLNRALTETAIPYGDAERRSAIRRKAEHSLMAPAEAQAARAGWFGLAKTRGRAAAVSEGDLLDDVANNKVRMDAVAPSALPEPLQGLSADERTRYIEDKRKARDEVLSKINGLANQRDEYIKKNLSPSKGSLDGKVRESVKKQAADIGLLY